MVRAERPPPSSVEMIVSPRAASASQRHSPRSSRVTNIMLLRQRRVHTQALPDEPRVRPRSQKKTTAENNYQKTITAFPLRPERCYTHHATDERSGCTRDPTAPLLPLPAGASATQATVGPPLSHRSAEKKAPAGTGGFACRTASSPGSSIPSSCHASSAITRYTARRLDGTLRP